MTSGRRRSLRQVSGVSPLPAQSGRDLTCMAGETAQNVPRQGILQSQEGWLSKQLAPASA